MDAVMHLYRACAFAMALVGLGASPALAADPANADLAQRGRYLATLGDCVACHTAPGGKALAGGLPVPTPFGPIFSTNITPSKTAGIGNYSLVQFADALRKGVRADGAHLYPAMPYTAYAQVSDDDVKALYAYFMTAVDPVAERAPATDLAFPFDIRLSMLAWNLLFLDSKTFAPEAGKGEEWNRGAYLVRGLAHCGTCHTPRNFLMAEETSRELGGGAVGSWDAPNITSDLNSGVGGWSEQELVDYLRTGRAQGKAQAGGPMGEAIDHSLSHLSDADLHAIATYVKTVPALRDRGDGRPVYAWGAASNDLVGIRGGTLPADPDQLSGPQLYDAYCATCHGSSGQGADNGVLPSLFHNTALGRSSSNNLVMAILYGVTPQTNTRGLLMPGFLKELSDRQIATLGSYLVQRYGNPGAQVTVKQVTMLRSGAMSSSLIIAARAGIAAVAVLAVIAAFFVLRRRRRRDTS